jgi:hypothetical protein
VWEGGGKVVMENRTNELQEHGDVDGEGKNETDWGTFLQKAISRRGGDQVWVG